MFLSTGDAEVKSLAKRRVKMQHKTTYLICILAIKTGGLFLYNRFWTFSITVIEQYKELGTSAGSSRGMRLIPLSVFN